MLCAKLSPELDAEETLYVGLSIASPEEQNGRAGKRDEEPDGEHSTDSNPEVTMLCNFSKISLMLLQPQQKNVSKF